MGRTGLKRQIDIQKSTSYYDLTLNQETSRYVFRILALKNIMETQKYGFQFRKQDLYKPIPTYTVKVDSSIDSYGFFKKLWHQLQNLETPQPMAH